MLSEIVLDAWASLETYNLYYTFNMFPDINDLLSAKG